MNQTIGCKSIMDYDPFLLPLYLFVASGLNGREGWSYQLGKRSIVDTK